MDPTNACSTDELVLDPTLALHAAHSNGRAAISLDDLRQEIVGGLLYTHSRANANTSRLLVATAFLYAQVELLHEKGIISSEELDARKAVVAEQVEKRFVEKGMGVDSLFVVSAIAAGRGGARWTRIVHCHAEPLTAAVTSESGWILTEG